MDGPDPVVAAPVDGEEWEAPQRPGDVVEQKVSCAEHQGRPDDGVGDSKALERVLRLPFGPEVGEMGLG